MPIPLEAVSDTQADAVVTEAAVMHEEIDRPPVHGELERDRGNVPFYAKLAGDADIHVSVSVMVVVETKLGARAGIEVHLTVSGDDEVIDADDIETTGEPAEVEFRKVGTETVLVGKFAAVTGTETEGTGLCIGCDGNAQGRHQENQDSFHD